MAFCSIPTCPGGVISGRRCETCGELDPAYAHQREHGLNLLVPGLNTPKGPGPITAFEEAVKGGLEAYDAIKEPATVARDIAVKGVFAGLRRLLYRRK